MSAMSRLAKRTWARCRSSNAKPFLAAGRQGYLDSFTGKGIDQELSQSSLFHDDHCVYSFHCCISQF